MAECGRHSRDRVAAIVWRPVVGQSFDPSLVAQARDENIDLLLGESLMCLGEHLA